MAILGFHIVLSLIAASVLQKLSARYSLGRKILSNGLFRFLPPSTEDLRVASGRSTKGLRKRGRNETREEDAEGFLVPKDAEVVLERSAVRSVDVLPLPFYVEFRWLVDFAVAFVLVYAVTELYCWLLPRRSSAELNLSLVWAFVLLGFCLKALTALSALYFRSVEDTGERSLTLCFGAVIFLLSMAFLMSIERIMDIGLLDAYRNFSVTAGEFLKSQDVTLINETRSPLMLYVILSLLLGVLGGMLVFPCFRFARMYADAVSRPDESPLGKLLLHASFFAPLMALLLWVRPIAREQLVEREDPLLSLEQLESLRIWAVVVTVALRFLTARKCLQAHLEIAHQKLEDLRTEAGRINSLEFQRMIGRIFFYLCTAALQYFAPVILLGTLACILKTAGEHSWLRGFGLSEAPPIPFILPFDTVEASTAPKRGDIQESLVSVYSLFNPAVNRGIWSLLLVTVSIITFGLNLVGVAYNSRFTRK